jgi:hypothetical protein
MDSSRSTIDDERLSLQRARRRVGIKTGFYIHALMLENEMARLRRKR